MPNEQWCGVRKVIAEPGDWLLTEAAQGRSRRGPERPPALPKNRGPRTLPFHCEALPSRVSKEGVFSAFSRCSRSRAVFASRAARSISINDRAASVVRCSLSSLCVQVAKRRSPIFAWLSDLRARCCLVKPWSQTSVPPGPQKCPAADARTTGPDQVICTRLGDAGVGLPSAGGPSENFRRASCHASTNRRLERNSATDQIGHLGSPRDQAKPYRLPVQPFDLPALNGSLTSQSAGASSAMSRMMP